MLTLDKLKVGRKKYNNNTLWLSMYSFLYYNVNTEYSTWEDYDQKEGSKCIPSIILI